MASSPASASCGSSFSWMKNQMSQDPCTVAAWLIELCQDPTSSLPALLSPLSSSSSGYLPPNGTSANACTCSWAFYNTIEACTVCQDFQADNYSSWSSSCGLLGQSSTITYWHSTVSFSSRTKLPRWAILNPSNWAAGTFNASQAEEIAEENLPDVTDASASQPTFSSSPSPSATTSSSSSSKKTNAGAIAGGVVAGLVVLGALALALWFFACRRRGLTGRRRRGPRDHIDLDADGGGPVMVQDGNPLTAHLRSNSVGATSPTSNRSPAQQQQRGVYQGYPVPGHGSPMQAPMEGVPTNVVLGITRTSRANSIPTVAEQLDEKRRIRTEQQQQNSTDRRRLPNAFTGSSQAGGRSSRSASMDDINTNMGSNTVEISHARSQSQTSGTVGSTTPHSQSHSRSSSSDKLISRRLSLKSAPWSKRRSRTVVNPSSPDPSSDARHEHDTSVSPLTPGTVALPLSGTVATAGATTTARDVIAAVPGARLPTARDREMPPPEYIK